MKQKQPKKQERVAAPARKGGFRHGDRAVIPEEALSFRERKVLATLRAVPGALTVRELGRKCFPGMRAKAGTYESEHTDGTKARNASGAAYRCVLNSLRRLVVGGFAIKAERGSYSATRPTTATTVPTTDSPRPQTETQETHP